MPAAMDVDIPLPAPTGPRYVVNISVAIFSFIRLAVLTVLALLDPPIR